MGGSGSVTNRACRTLRLQLSQLEGKILSERNGERRISHLLLSASKQRRDQQLLLRIPQCGHREELVCKDKREVQIRLQSPQADYSYSEARKRFVRSSRQTFEDTGSPRSKARSCFVSAASLL